MTAAASNVAVVAIGRNEGERLQRCLASIASSLPVVYVDSGSIDGSIAAAEATGATVVTLDLSVPFTAARARNAGRSALPPGVAFIQFVDGDCMLQPGWLDRACRALSADPGLAAVFGRRREIAPRATIYNWLCDIEWAVPAGPARRFGGDVLLRAEAFDAAGGYPDEMIAGEEPDLSIRLNARGWRIECLPAEMTLHDAAMTRFGQWWRRAERSGHAYAELELRHPGSYSHEIRSILFWGAALPATFVILSLFAAATYSSWLSLATGIIALLPIVQLARLFKRERRHRTLHDAIAWAWFLVLGKLPHAIGVGRCYWSRLLGHRTPLIEYKGVKTVPKGGV